LTAENLFTVHIFILVFTIFVSYWVSVITHLINKASQNVALIILDLAINTSSILLFSG